MELSENTNEEKSTSSKNPNSPIDKTDQDPLVHNTRARTAARKEELQKSSSIGRAEKRLKTTN